MKTTKKYIVLLNDVITCVQCIVGMQMSPTAAWPPLVYGSVLDLPLLPLGAGPPPGVRAKASFTSVQINKKKSVFIYFRCLGLNVGHDTLCHPATPHLSLL